MFHAPTTTTNAQMAASAPLLRRLPATRSALVRAAEEGARRAQQDLQVDERRPVLDVPQVELDPLGPGEPRPAVDLRPARDARPDVEPVTLPLVVLVDLITERRPRPDDRHVAAHNVPELWQLVQRQPAQDPAGTRDPRVAAVDRVPGAEPLGADDHRAQLEELEVEAVLADARLPVENGPAVLELDRERGNGQERARDDEPGPRDRDVRGSLHRGRLSPRVRLGWRPGARVSPSELARARPGGLGGRGPRHTGVAVMVDEHP